MSKEEYHYSVKPLEIGGREVSTAVHTTLRDHAEGFARGDALCIFTEVSSFTRTVYPMHFLSEIDHITTDGDSIHVKPCPDGDRFFIDGDVTFLAWNTTDPLFPSPYGNAGQDKFTAFAQVNKNEDEIRQILENVPIAIMYRQKR